MHHKAHIWLVNTHTKCDSRHYHLHFLHQERILIGASGRSIHARMVCQRRYIIHAQSLCQLLHGLAAQTIHNTRFAIHTADIANQIFIHIVCLLTYFVIQIRTIKRRLKHRRIHHIQVLLDIALHLRCCSRGQCNDWCLTNTLHDGVNPAILWTEIVSPLRDTMRFIHGIERDLYIFQEVHILIFI